MPWLRSGKSFVPISEVHWDYKLSERACPARLQFEHPREREMMYREMMNAKAASEKEAGREKSRFPRYRSDIRHIPRVVPIVWQEPASITTFRNYLRVCNREGDNSYRVSPAWPPAPRPAVDQIDTWAKDTSGRTCRCHRPSGRCPRDKTTRSGDGDLQNRCD